MNENPNNTTSQGAVPTPGTAVNQPAVAQPAVTQQVAQEVKNNVPTPEMYQAPTDLSAVQFENVVPAEPKKEEPKPAFVVIDPRAQPKEPESEKTVIEKKIENALITTKSETHSRDEIDNYRQDAILCYIPFVSIYELVSKKAKEAPYLFFHVNQGFALTLHYCFVFVINYILKTLFKVDNVYLSTLPGSVRVIRALLVISGVALSTFGMINSYNGKSKELPFIGRMRLLRYNIDTSKK